MKKFCSLFSKKVAGLTPHPLLLTHVIIYGTKVLLI